MKKYISTYIFLTLLNILNAQVCYQAPSIDFEGTSIAWSYQVEDPLIDSSACIGTVFEHQRSDLWVKPLEYEDKYIVVFGNGRNGTIINAFDKNDGSILWQKIINHTNTLENRGFGCPHVNRLGKDSIELLGYRSYYEAGSATSLKTGFLNRIVISDIDGKELSYQDIPTTNILYIYGLGNTYPSTLEGDILYNFGCYSTSTDTIGIVCNNVYAEKKSLLKYLPSSYPNLYPGTPDISDLSKDAEEIHFYHTDSNGEKVLYKGFYNSKIINDSFSIYLIQYISDSKYQTVMVKIDKWGNLVSSEIDISEFVNGDGTFAWNRDWIDQYDHKLRIHLNNLEGYPHRGYVDIDFEGNIIRNRKELEIDGMIPRFHRTLDLLDSDNVLHVFRPLENNDLFIYSEDTDGNYTKIGELLNPNDSFYVFYAKYLFQASDGDLFIGLKTIINSEFSDFNMGGWGSLLKIEAEELGISVGTKENERSSENIKIYPNPTKGGCFISTNIEAYPLTVMMYNTTGLKVMEKLVSSKLEMLDISLTSKGIYVARILNNKKELIGNKKIIKIE